MIKGGQKVSKEVENNAAEEAVAEKKGGISENTVEVLVAIFLGITALLTAWATWIGSLHGGNQATNYTKSNNLAAEGNSEYNAAFQDYLSDLMVWNTLMEYYFDQELADARGDYLESEMIEAKIETYLDSNGSQNLIDAFDQMTDDMNSPFEVEGMTDNYFTTAYELLDESQALLEEGQADNAHGDAYNLVTVIYSLVLFMLGIVGIFKRIPNRMVVLVIAVIGLIIATIYMCTIPMPTGFDLASFFAG